MSFARLKASAAKRAQGRSAPAVRTDLTGQSLYATRAYRPGDVVFQFRNAVWKVNRDRHTVEHPSGAHLFHPLLAKTAHGCELTCRIDIPH
jgi:hypothetical protein